MAMGVNWERQDGVAIAVLNGRIDGSNTDELQRTLEAGTDSEDTALILDFEAVSYINSTGLRIVLKVAKQCRQSGTKFGLCGLSAATRPVVANSGLDRVIATFESRDRALIHVSRD